MLSTALDSIFCLLVLINLRILLHSEAATISIGDDSRGASRSSFKHLGNRNLIPTTNAPTNRHLGDVIHGNSRKFVVRTLDERNLNHPFVINEGTVIPQLFGDFVSMSNPGIGEGVTSEASVRGNIGLPRRHLNVRKKRFGKASGHGSKIKNFSNSNILKAGGIHFADGVSRNISSTGNHSSTSVTTEETAPPTVITKEGVKSTNSTDIATTELSTSSADVAKEFASTNGERMIIFSSEVSSFTNAEESDNTGKRASLTSVRAATEVTVDSSSETTTRPMVMTVIMHSTTATETDAEELSTGTETNDSTTTESTVISEAIAESSRSTDVTEAKTTVETITMTSVPITTKYYLRSSSSTASEKLSSSAGTASATISVAPSLPTTEQNTMEVSSSVEEEKTKSSAGIATYSSTPTTKEIDTEESLSTISPVTLSTLSTTELDVEESSDTKSEKTTNSLVETSTASSEVMTKETEVEISVKTIVTKNTYTAPVHSAKVDYTSSTRKNWESSTADAYIESEDEKSATLSPGTIAWIIIGILMVLAALSGGIFLGNKYRSVYQKREDTIILVRNPNHRTYF